MGVWGAIRLPANIVVNPALSQFIIDTDRRNGIASGRTKCCFS